MSDVADNNGSDPNATDTASEHMIPKHRFDEVLGRLRSLEQDVQVKNELLNQFRPKPQAEPEVNYEEMGLDPQLGKVLHRLVDQVSSKRVNEASARFQNTIADLHRRNEELAFLSQHGQDKAKYLDRIKQVQVNHWNATRTAMPIETAYKLAVFEDMTNATKPRQGAQAPAQQAAPAPAPQMGLPDSSQTGNQQQSATQTPAQGFNEMSFEDMESLLNSQITARGGL